MSDINRLVEIMAETLIKHDEMVNQQMETNKRLDKMQEEMSKLNLLSAENNRAILKLANSIETQANLEPRVSKLEKAVFK